MLARRGTLLAGMVGAGWSQIDDRCGRPRVWIEGLPDSLPAAHRPDRRPGVVDRASATGRLTAGANGPDRSALRFGTVDSRTSMPRVGMVGGGQLARMTHQAAIALGQTLRVLSVSADDSAALVTPDVEIGEHTDLAALRRFAAGLRRRHLRPRARSRRAHPGPGRRGARRPPRRRRAAVRAGQGPDAGPAGRARRCRCRPSTMLDDARRDRAVGRAVTGFGDRARLAGGGQDRPRRLRRPRRLGGRLAPRRSPRCAGPGRRRAAACSSRSSRCSRELAAVVARSPFGQAAAWPVVQTVQQDGICVEVIAPAPGLDDDTAAAADQAGPADRGRARRRRRAGRRAVPGRRPAASRPTGWWSTNWPCARTTPGTGRWTAR